MSTAERGPDDLVRLPVLPVALVSLLQTDVEYSGHGVSRTLGDALTSPVTCSSSSSWFVHAIAATAERPGYATEPIEKHPAPGQFA